MESRTVLVSALTIGLVLAILHSMVSLKGQTKPATSEGTVRPGAILVDTDDSCRLVLDGKDQGVVKPDEAKKISVGLGDHILKCTVEGIPDLAWRKVIEVKNSKQVAILISLKAIHIQYDEATAKLEMEKSKPARCGYRKLSPSWKRENLVCTQTLSAGETDRGNHSVAIQRRSESRSGECKEQSGVSSRRDCFGS
jgi:hypothetical protein